MSHRILTTLALAMLCCGLLMSPSGASPVVIIGPPMRLEIRLDGKTMAHSIWPERTNASPTIIWSYIGRDFASATKDVLPRPAKGTTVTLKGSVVIQLSWLVPERVLDTFEVDQLTLTYLEPRDGFPNEIRWSIEGAEIARIRDDFDSKREKKPKSSE
jgi:hypothetical protein